MTAMLSHPSPRAGIGPLLRSWRERRRKSQLELALDAEISARHLSFLETGRSAPSREMVLKLSRHLELPLRERNILLSAAGFAPVFPERRLDDPALAAARHAVELVIEAHRPYPALAIDRHWTLVAQNAAVGALLDGVAPKLLAPPVNVLRLSLHPDGLAPRIVNLDAWRAHLLDRLGRQIEASADAALMALRAELESFAPRAPGRGERRTDDPMIVVPLELAGPTGVLRLLSTTTVFGTPLDVTLAELAIEAFYPADAATAESLRRLATHKP